MNFDNVLIIAKGENVTNKVTCVTFVKDKCEITYAGNKKYCYSANNVHIIDSFVSLCPDDYSIIHNGKILYDIVSINGI